MRNSQAQRYARWSAVIALLLVAVVAGVYIRREIRAREAEKKAPPPVPASIEQRSSEFSFSKVEGDQTIFTVNASRATQFKKGSRDLLEDVSVTIYGREGERNDSFQTRACDYIPSTGEMSCKGQVQFTLQPASPPKGKEPEEARIMRVSTSQVSFDRDSGIARTEQPVTFRWPSGAGSAVGAQYDSNDGTLELDRNVDLKLASAPAKSQTSHSGPDTPVELTSNSMTLRRKVPVIEMNGQVHARQAGRELSADRLLLQLDNSLQPRRATASGHPKLRDDEGPGQFTLQAGEITVPLAPEGWAESVTATQNVRGTLARPQGQEGFTASRIDIQMAPRGSFPRVLTARGGVVLTSRGSTVAGGTQSVQTQALRMRFSNLPPSGGTRLDTVESLAPATAELQRSVMRGGKAVAETTHIHARQVNLRFAHSGKADQIEQLSGSGGVEIARQAGHKVEQTTSSHNAVVRFSPGGAWTTIDQSGNVRFQQGVQLAQAEHARLDHSANSATLTGSVVLADGSTRTTAQSMVFVQGASQLRAEGSVITSALRAGSGTIANLAPQPAHVAADRLVADTAHGHAVYSGHGRLWQGASVIDANTIDLDKSSGTVVARGHVRGVFPMEAKPGEQAAKPAAPKGAERWKVAAAQLTYWNTQARAELQGGVKADSPQGSLQADRMDLYFSPSGAPGSAEQLERAVAAGNVVVSQPGRRGTSERAEYTAAEGKFVLSGGKPTLYDSSGDTVTGRQLTFYFADDRIVVDSGNGSRTVTIHRVEK